MNTIIEKVEINRVEEFNASRPVPAGSDSPESLSPVDEALLDEHAGKKIYRRSTAYFLFGFGYNKHSIITDES